MSGMKNRVWNLVWLAVLFLAAIVSGTSRAEAQTASIEFVAHATPSGGLEEPVRGFPFYLLSKSFAEIQKEATAAYPKPDLNSFIEKRDVSPELRAWMKKNAWVTLSGDDFTHKLRADDILGVPEFKDAYIERNVSERAQGFPKLNVKPADQRKDPAKFAKLTQEYLDAIHQYIEHHPESVEQIDISLASIDPSPQWSTLEGTRTTSIHQRTLELAQGNYLVARAETNLLGQGSMRGLAPGTYWLSTLDVPATVGDARPRWDIPVVVGASETKYVTLSNSNAVRLQASQ